MALLNELISDGRNEKKMTSFPVVMVHYSKLVPSEANNYSVNNIRELANMVLLSGGIKQNLLVRKKTPDEYEVIAGHRRRLAVKYIVEELGHEEYSMVPVHVEKDGDLLSEVDLILTNCGARERSGWEKMMEVTRLTDLLKAMQTGSEIEQGRFRQLFGREPGLGGRELRKVIAETLGLSETAVANLNHINSKLDSELKEQFRNGKIGVSVANEAAGLSPEKQKELAGKDEIRLADVKQRHVSESDTGKKGSSKEIPCFEIEGQYEFETDFPEIMPDEVVTSQLSEDAAVSAPSPVFTMDVADLVGEDDAEAVPEGAAMISQQKEEPTIDDIDLSVSTYNRLIRAGILNLSEIRSMSDEELIKIRGMSDRILQDIRDKVNQYYGNQEVLSAYSTKKIVYPEDSLIAIEGCEGRHHCTLCSMDCQIRQKDRDCRYATCGNPFPCTTMNVLENLRDEVGDECQFINHELADITAGSHEPDPCCMKCQNPCGYACARAAHGTSEPESASGHQETVMLIVPTGEEPEPDQDDSDVIDAEFTEIPAEPVKIFDRRILQKLIDCEQKMIDDLQEVWKSTKPWNYTKHVMMLQAFQNLMETGGKTKEVEPAPVEQPEFPVLKNNDQRKAWIDKFHDWPVWFEVPYANEVYYRYDLPDGSSIIICEYRYFAEWKTKYMDENPECTGTREYLLNPGYHYLDDCKTNRSALIEKLKEIQKKGK